MARQHHSFFTIGHSRRPIQEFAALLQDARIKLVIDVRTVPRSRTNPQYNQDVLPTSLVRFGMGYLHIEELGGLRARSHDISKTMNGFWSNESFHNYADYALSRPFQTGLRKLRRAGHAQRCAIMCAEAVWWRCHRRIIADYLIAAGETVFHIMGAGRTEAARPTAAARPGPKGTLIYPALASV